MPKKALNVTDSNSGLHARYCDCIGEGNNSIPLYAPSLVGKGVGGSGKSTCSWINPKYRALLIPIA
jgi:hypothetical protein